MFNRCNLKKTHRPKLLQTIARTVCERMHMLDLRLTQVHKPATKQSVDNAYKIYTYCFVKGIVVWAASCTVCYCLISVSVFAVLF